MKVFQTKVFCPLETCGGQVVVDLYVSISVLSISLSISLSLAPYVRMDRNILAQTLSSRFQLLDRQTDR